MDKKTIEIPFGAKDSELYKFEYTIPEGYEAEIKDGKVIMTKKEIEDERIRKWLIDYFDKVNDEVVKEDRLKIIAYLEKQKEQKSDGGSSEKLNNHKEWSEKEKMHLYNAIEAVKYCYDTSKGTGGFKCVEFLKSLRPQPHWKPSEEQMDALLASFKKDEGVYDYYAIESLYNDLLKLL